MRPHSHISSRSTGSWVPPPYAAGMCPRGRTLSQIHGHLHPTLRGCVPVVVFLSWIRSSHWAPTPTSFVSFGTVATFVLVLVLVSTLILDSWAPSPTISSTHHFQGHLHPTLWGHTRNCHLFPLHSWLMPTPTNPGLKSPNHHLTWANK